MAVPAQLPDRTPCKLAFVAEAPSWEELSAGKPLVGPAGRVFNIALRSAGIRREECLVTNVFNEKLPENEVRHWCMRADEARAIPGGTDLPPLGDAGFLRMEHRWHLERLAQELLEAGPTVIVPLGGTALWALTGALGISGVRGTVLAASKLRPGVKMVPAFHPAAVMRQWKFFPVLVGDLAKARGEADKGPKIVLPRRELWIEPTLADLEQWTPRLLGADLLSVDIETAWTHITSIGFAPNAEEAIVVPFLDERNVSRSYWTTTEAEVAAWKWVRMILASPVPKLGQNFGGYDAFRLLIGMRIAPRNFREDTRLLSHALYPELPKDLEFLGASFANQGAWKVWGHKSDKRDN